MWRRAAGSSEGTGGNYAVWPTRPDLQRAFLAGYDRALSAEERHALHLITTKVAVSYLHTGITTTNQALVDRGRTDLGHLLADGQFQ